MRPRALLPVVRARITERLFPARARAAREGEFARRVALADAARDRGDLLAAADGYDAALALDAGHAGVWVQLGNMAKDAGDAARAEAAYQAALRLRPDDADTHLQYARLLAGAGALDGARARYRRAQDLGDRVAGEELARLDPPPPEPEFAPELVSGPDPGPRLVSRIEHADAAGVRGWIVDETAPDRLLRVACRINGLTVACVAATGFNRELQDRYGGAGRHGFQVRFAPTPELAGLAEAVLEVVEPESGQALLQGERLRLSDAPLLEAGEALRRGLEAHRAEVDRLLGQLAAAGAGRPAPLGAYPRLADAARPPSPPEGVASGGLDVVVWAGASKGALAAVADGLAGQTLKPRSVRIVGEREGDAGRLAAELARRGLDAGVHEGAAGRAVAEAVRAGAGEHLLFLTDHDALRPEAAAWLVHASGSEGRLAYADSDVVTGAAPQDIEPRFRTALDEDLLIASDEYDAPFCLARAACLPLLEGLDAASDPWLALRLGQLERAGRGGFRHAPLVLSRRFADPAQAGVEAEARARTVQPHLDRTAPGARLEAHDDPIAGAVPGRHKAVWPAGEGALISLVVLTREGAPLVGPLAESLAAHAARPGRFEMTAMVNNSADPQARAGLEALAARHPWLRVVERAGAFSWSGFNNAAAAEARGQLLLFLNDDMLCLTPGWDDRLRGQLLRPGVGAVGARLLYPDGTLQHAGVVLRGPTDAAHEGAGDAPGHGLYRRRTQLAHDTAAVTGAFFGISRALFDRLGGFAEDFPTTYNDLEVCERVWAAGRRVVYDPWQVWTHYESVSRGFDSNDPEKSARHDEAIARLGRRPGRQSYLDLRYNPHFDRRERPFFTLRWPGADDVAAWLDAQALPSGRG